MHVPAFDDLAEGYDAAFTDTAVGRVLRELVWSRLEVTFRPGQRVLELGCGTGEDAIWLARRGVRVLATDVSSSMIAVAREKALRQGCSASIEFRGIAMEDVPALLKDSIFDGVFSNFGALNCAEDLSSLLPAISRRIVAGGALVAVVMGRYVPWEWIWYLFRADPRRSLRRLRRDGVPWRGVRITYPTPGETAAMLRPSFEVTRLSPLGCVLPPTYAAGWLNRSPRTLRLLTRLERLAQRSALLSRISDHFIVEAVNSPLH